MLILRMKFNFLTQPTYTYISISLPFIFTFLCMCFEILSFPTRRFHSQFYNIYHHNDAQWPTDTLEDCHAINSGGQCSSIEINQLRDEEERRGKRRIQRTRKGFMHNKKPLSKALRKLCLQLKCFVLNILKTWLQSWTFLPQSAVN
jgi:ribosomal protein L44E